MSFQSASLYVGNAAQLDSFLQSIYTFYVYGGFRNYCLARAVEVCKLLLLCCLFMLVCAFVDFDTLIDDLNKEQAAEHIQFAEHVRYVGLSWYAYPFAAALFLYTAAVLIQVARQFHVMLAVRDFYRYELRVRSDDDLQRQWRWVDVVDALCACDTLQRVGLGDDPRHVVARLLRRDNYVVALLASGCLSMRQSRQTPSLLFTPSFAPDANVHTDVQDDDDAMFLSADTLRDLHDACSIEFVHPAFTQSLHSTLQIALFAFVFRRADRLCDPLAALVEQNSVQDDADVNADADAERVARLRQEFERNETVASMARTLRVRLRLLAIAWLICAPILLCLLLLYLLFEHGDQLHGGAQRRSAAARDALETRVPTHEALYVCRLYNEVPHLLRQRLSGVHSLIDSFAQRRSFSLFESVARVLLYASAALMALIALLGVVHDDDALTRINLLFDRSAIWWLGVLGATATTLRSLLRVNVQDDNDATGDRGGQYVALRGIAKRLLVWPDRWFGNEHSDDVRRLLTTLFAQRTVDVARELLSVLATPYLLWTVLAPRSKQMLDFIVDSTVVMPTVGHVVRHSELRVRDEVGGRSRQRSGSDVERQRSESRVALQKAQLSLLHFCRHYPHSRPHESAAPLLEHWRERALSAKGEPRSTASHDDADLLDRMEHYVLFND